MKTILGIIIGVLFYKIVLKPLLENKFRKDAERFDNMKSQLAKAMEESVRETKLMRSNETPTDEDILLYYKMYLKKDEIEKRNTWTTVEPMSFEEWEKRAKSETKEHKITERLGFMEYGGYAFMVTQTCDMMIGFPPSATFQRVHDYKAMVLAEENNERTENEES